MLDIWVDIITLKIMNMTRDGYGIDTRLSNDYVDEIKQKAKYSILCFLDEHDDEIRRQTIDEFVKNISNRTEYMFGQKYVDMRKILEYAEQMKEVRDEKIL